MIHGELSDLRALAKEDSGDGDVDGVCAASGSRREGTAEIVRRIPDLQRLDAHTQGP